MSGEHDCDVDDEELKWAADDADCADRRGSGMAISDLRFQISKGNGREDGSDGKYGRNGI